MLKRILIIINIFCLLAALGGCKYLDRIVKEEAPTVKIHVVEPYRSIFFIPLYASLEEGLFEREGLEVTLETATDQENAVKIFMNGRGQFLLAGPEVSLYQYQQDQSKKLIMLAKAGAINGSLLLARKKTPAFTWQDLKGKVIIGNSEAELSHLLLKHILKSNGLRPLQDVHLIYNLPRQAAAGAFIGGSGDYLLAMEPLVSRLEKDHNFQVITSIGREYSLPLSAAFMVREDFLLEYKPVGEKFLIAFQKGLEWVDSHTPEEIVSMAQKYFPTEEEKVLLRAVSRYKTLGCWPLSLLLEEESLSNLQELMLAQKELKEKIPPGTLLDALAQKALEQNK